MILVQQTLPFKKTTTFGHGHFLVRLYRINYKSINLPLCFLYAHVSSQDKTSDKQTVISSTPELFRSVSDSQSQTSPLFTRHGCFIRHPVVCVEKLSQDLIPASTDSNFHTQDSAAATSPKQEDLPFSKCPVFTQKDFKQKKDLREDKDCCKNTNASEDDTQISDEDTHLPTQVSQGLSTGPYTCLSPSKRSSPKFVPKNSTEDVTVASVSRTSLNERFSSYTAVQKFWVLFGQKKKKIHQGSKK